MAIRCFPVLTCAVLASSAAYPSGARAQSVPPQSVMVADGFGMAIASDTLFRHERVVETLLPGRGTAVACGITALATHGQASPLGDGGTLSPWGHARSAAVNNLGEAILLVDIAGAARNQAMVIAGVGGLRAIAVGCGGAGGAGSTDACGDPAPGGGSFSGFLAGNAAAPDINDNGDVLFLADPHAAGITRALYQYQAQDDQIVRLAAIGDLVEGRTITAIGTGSMNNQGDAVFLAVLDGASQADILSWKGGEVSIYVKAGDPAPGGGQFLQFGTEFWGMGDGTQLPGGPVPALNDVGQIAFRANVAGGQAEQGLFLSADGEHEWLIKLGDPVPGGGSYAGFQGPLLNNAGQIAFYTDTAGGPGAAWVTGSPGSWRRALAWFDLYQEGTIWSLAYSRSPVGALADNGDLILGTTFLQADNSTELSGLVLNRADGESRVVAVQGQTTPLGGSWNQFEAWPTLNGRHQLRVGALTGGIPGLGVNSQLLIDLCTDGSPAFESMPAVGAPIDFGQVALGQAAQRLIDVGNSAASGAAPDSALRLFHARVDHPAITVELVDRGPIAHGAMPDGIAELVITCAPLETEMLTATVTVISNDPNQPSSGFAYPVSCQGIADVLFRDGFEQP